MLRPFARGFKLRTCKQTQQLPTMLGVDQYCIRLHVAKSLTGFKLCAQQLRTTRNNMQQGMQMNAACDIQQCGESLANNVASVFTGKLYVMNQCPMIRSDPSFNTV